MKGLIVGIYTEILGKRPFKVAVYYMEFGRHCKTIDFLSFYTYRELVIGALKYFSQFDPEFLSNVAKLDDDRFMASKSKHRRYISDSRDLLYIASPHLTKKFSVEVDGYWVATNIGRTEALEVISYVARALKKKQLSFSYLKEKAFN